MKKEIIKTTNYIVKVNSEFHKAFCSLREARLCIRAMSQHHIENQVTVELIKQVVLDTLMNTYTTKPINVLTAAALYVD